MNERLPRDRRAPPFPAIAALIPAYNEEAVIRSVVAATLDQVTDVIVVDDGSTDGTADLAAAAGAEVLRLPRNRGKAGAVMAGFAAALARGYTIVVMLDADGQHLPSDLPRVLAPVLSGEADLVVGSRFLEVRSEIPRYRVLGQKTLNLFTALGAGVSLTDTQSGFRALGPAALARLDFVSDGYSLESDMIAHFASCGLRITEVPISCRYDVPNGHKKNPVLHGFEIVRAMSYAIAVRQRRALGVIGVPCVMFGSAMGATPALLPQSALQLSSPGLVGGLLAIGSLFIVGSLWPLLKTRRSSRRAPTPSASR
jgi:glycosyltransferase involved in cell wall biosynthesis